MGDAGTLSIFFNTTYNGKEYRAGMFDGAGARLIADEWMKLYNKLSLKNN